MNYNLGDIVTMKKVHPCGSYDFEIIRLGILFPVMSCPE